MIPPFSKEPVINCRSCFHPLGTSLQPHCLLPHGTEWHSLEGDPRYVSAYMTIFLLVTVTIHCNITLLGGLGGQISWAITLIGLWRIASLSMYICHETVDCNYTKLSYCRQANTFQVVIVADQQMTFVFFIYHDIQWGDGANVGFNAGDGTRFFMVPGALTNQVLNIDEGSNVDVTGVYIYRVDLCSVLGPRDGEKPKLLLYYYYYKYVLGKFWWTNNI